MRSELKKEEANERRPKTDKTRGRTSTKGEGVFGHFELLNILANRKVGLAKQNVFTD